MKNKSAIEKCLDLARDQTVSSTDDDPGADLFIPDVDPDPSLIASEGVPSGGSSPRPIPEPGTMSDDLAQPSSVDFDPIDLETAELRISGRQRKPHGNLLIRSKIGLLSFVILRTLMAHTYTYSAFKVTKIHKVMRMHARMINHIEIINLNADATYNYMHPLSFATKNGDNEVYYLHEVMRQEDREDFIIAMKIKRLRITVVGGIGNYF